MHISKPYTQESTSETSKLCRSHTSFLQSTLEDLFQSDQSMQLQSVRTMKSILVHDEQYTENCHTIINHPNLVSRLCELATDQTCAFELRLESSCILANLASVSGEALNTLVNTDFLGTIISLMKGENPKIVELAYVAIGNIIGDTDHRNTVLRTYGDCILDRGRHLIQLNDNAFEAAVARFIWTMMNIVRPTFDVEFEFLIPKIIYIATILFNDYTHLTSETTNDIAWTIAFITDIEVLEEDYFDTELLVNMRDLIDSNTKTTSKAAFRTIGNIIADSDYYTQILVNDKVTDYIGNEILHNGANAKDTKDALLVLSNIVIDESGPFVDHLLKDDLATHIINMVNENVSEEAFFVIINAFVGADYAQSVALANVGAVDAICRHLSNDRQDLVFGALEAILSMLTKDGSISVFQEKLTMNGAFEQMDKLMEEDCLPAHANLIREIMVYKHS
ncbi:hypothetical protein P9112_001615 [Eukaryota sp. TZLM1-RC]